MAIEAEVPSRNDRKKIQEAFAILKKRGIPQTIVNAIPVYDELVARDNTLAELAVRLKTAIANGVLCPMSNDEMKFLLDLARSRVGKG